MPTLPRYTAEIQGGALSGGRRAAASDFAGPASNIGGAIAVGADKYLTSIEDEESRKALVESSQLRAKYARELDAAALSGGDLDKLKEKMRADFAKIGESFQTKKGVSSNELYTANTEIMFDEQANAIMVQRAGAKAKLDAASFLNSTASVMRSVGPQYLPEAEANADAFAATLTGVRPEQRAAVAADLKQDLNMAAALASARIDPAGTRKRLEAGEWNLSPQHRQTAISHATSEENAARVAQNYARAEEDRRIAKADEAARDRHFASIMDGTATRRQIMDDPDLRPATREHMIAVMKARSDELTNGEKKSDQGEKRRLFLAATAPDTDPTKIINSDQIHAAVAAGKLNTADGAWLMGIVANQKDANNQTIGGKLRVLSINFDRAVAGDLRLSALDAGQRAEIQNDYAAAVFARVEEARKANDVKLLRDLFDPASKEYVGNKAFMQQSIDAAKVRLQESLPPAVKVNSKAEYDALPDGTPYTDSKGVRGIKRGASKPASTAPFETSGGSGPSAERLARRGN